MLVDYDNSGKFRRVFKPLKLRVKNLRAQFKTACSYDAFILDGVLRRPMQNSEAELLPLLDSKFVHCPLIVKLAVVTDQKSLVKNDQCLVIAKWTLIVMV